MESSIRRLTVSLVVFVLAAYRSAARAAWYHENVERRANAVMMELRYPR